MKSKALLQRLGFLSDLLDRPLPEDVRAALRAAIPRHYRFQFGRKTRRRGDIGYVSEWGLFVNATRKGLLTDVPGAAGGRLDADPHAT
jgi:hypothetical protein